MAPFHTPDRTGGPSNEEELQLYDDGQDPSVIGGITNNGGELKGRDNAGVFNLRSGGGISEAQHNALRVLIHLADGVGGPMENFASGAYRETLPVADPFPTSITWWESNAKLKKIVEKLITWTGAFPTTIQWKAYDTDGTTVLATVTDAITYSGPFETTRTRTIA